MASIVLLVIAQPGAPFLKALSNLPADIALIVARDAKELEMRAPEADIILYADIDGDLLSHALMHANRVRWIHSLWTGVEGILKPALTQHPATLTNGRGVFRWPLADWVVAAMLFFAFDLRRVIRQQEQVIWKPVIGTSLNGRTLGIVGYGAVGSAAAARARPFGMKIAALRRQQNLFESDSLVDEIYAADQLQKLMAASDYVLVATPLTAETHGMIGEAELSSLRPEAVVINVGRGPVINEPALLRALESNRIRGAALDVFDTEPLPPAHPFWRMPNVLLSPHTADRIEGFLDPAFECFHENLNRFRGGSPLLNVVDKTAGY
jgi:phosphoglycerate dehydrogenase-like enzyme